MSFEYTSFNLDYKGHNIQCYKIGNGKNVVLSLPSYPSSGLSFVVLANFHEMKDFTLLTFDVPGWLGLSENVFTDNNFDIGTVVDIAKHLVVAMNYERVNIIGYSFGGSIAVKFAANYPEIVNKIVLVSTVINSFLIRNSTQFRIITLVQKLGIKKLGSKIFINRMMRIINRRLEINPIPESLKATYFSMTKNIQPEVLIDAAYKLFHIDLTEDLLKLPSERLLIVNSKEEGKIFRKQAEYIRKLLKNEKSEYLHGTHDDFLLRARNEPAERVIEFLRE